MTEFTPSTEQVREGYIVDPVGEFHDPINAASNEAYLGRAFDRWLAKDRAEVAAAALEEAANIFYVGNFYRMPDGSEGHYQQAHVRNDTQRRLRAKAAEIREAAGL